MQKMLIGYIAMALLVFVPIQASAHGSGDGGGNFVQVQVTTAVERTELANMGVSIESVMSDSIYGTVSNSVLRRLQDSKYKIIQTFKTTDIQPTDFPAADQRFHNFTELTAELNRIVAANSAIMRKFSIGKTIQGRDIWAVRINTNMPNDNVAYVSGKPGVVFMGNHHAREHVSAEIPLMLLQYLGENYQHNPEVTRLIDTRDIFIIPMVNPDGVEYDIASRRYRMHRKNMRDNGDGTYGVDLNRNYGYQWGTGGSSNDTTSDVYMGPAPFSEPETQAIKSFVEGHSNLKVLLTFHTFSELILYPWGSTFDPIAEQRDHDTYKAMAEKMATWNHYKPEQASELYIASGDTCDWAWGAQRVFSFTFELSPRSMFSGGFYPGASVLDKVFNDNLRPALYLIDLADDPYRALNQADTRLSWLNEGM